MKDLDTTGLFKRFTRELKRAMPRRRPESPTLVIAFSGGPDSLALCLLLKQAVIDTESFNDMGSLRLVAFHVHHGLRGESSDRDQAFARAKAEELGFKFDTIKLEPPAPEDRGSTEAWAREARYAALSAAAVKWDAHVVLTAHHKDDQAETVIQRLIRGSEYRGLAGMSVSRPLMPNSNVRLIRPLLTFSRDELEAFLEVQGENAVLDETNLDTKMQRNRIRLNILPALERAWPHGSVTDALCEMATSAGKIHKVLDNVAGLVLSCSRFEPLHEMPMDLYQPFADPKAAHMDAKCIFDKDYLLNLPSLFLYPLLMKTMERLSPGKETSLSRERFRQAQAWLKSDSMGNDSAKGKEREYALGSGMLLREEAAGISVLPQPGEKETTTTHPPFPMPVPGEATLPDKSRLTLEVIDDPDADLAARIDDDPLIEHLDADVTGSDLSVRQRGPGDRFHPLGARGEKKLKSFLIDQKIPEPFRESLGLLCNESDVIWVMGLRVHHAYRITKNTRRVLRLQVHRP